MALRYILAIIGLAFIISGCGTLDEAEIAQSVLRVIDAVSEELEKVADGEPAPGPEDIIVVINPGDTAEDLGPVEDDADIIPYMTPVGISIPSFDDSEDDRFGRWGYWARMVERDLAVCVPLAECDPPRGTLLFHAYITTIEHGLVNRIVEGDLSGTTPTSGVATWVGGVRGVTERTTACDDPPCNAEWRALEGRSVLTLDIAQAEIDVDFTHLGSRVGDLSWEGIPVNDGGFMADDESISGDFYGADHDGVAGIFSWDNARGIFGAIRDQEVIAQ